MKAFCVLRSGPTYKPQHVQDLCFQLSLQAPFIDLTVLSDVDVPGVKRIALKSDWPGWWAKMELFRPDITGDFLYIDLDTQIVGGMEDFADLDKLTIVRDFYRDGVRRPEGLQSCLMYLPEADRVEVWKHWRAELIRGYRGRGLGDQAFLETLWMDKAQRFQDVLPGQVVSYKVHCKHGGVPEDARVVCFHGAPRPWQVQLY